jgi:hypothetical protein
MNEMSTTKLHEDRKMAIHLLRSGRSPQEVANQLDRSLRWVYKWQGRFKENSWAGLVGQSHAPKQPGRRLPPVVRQAIIYTRSALEVEAAEGGRLKYIGAAAVQGRLKNQVTPVPSLASINRVIQQAGLSKGQREAKPIEIKYPHLQPTEAHQVIEVDIVPHFLTGGAAVACFNALDIVSHYPTGQPFNQRRAEDAVTFLIQVWQELGLADYTQVDNEACFSGGFSHKGVLGQVVRLALWVGTELVFIPLRHPESNGTVERFHQDYNQHVWQATTLHDRQDVQQHGQAFFQAYRLSPHQTALKGHCPLDVHQRQPRPGLPPDFQRPKGTLPLREGRVHFIRRINLDGTVTVLNLTWAVPQPDLTKGVWVTIDFRVSGATLSIYDTAPDVLNRHCLATYPFPLVEPVQARPIPAQATQPIGLLPAPLTLMLEATRWSFHLVSQFFGTDH